MIEQDRYAQVLRTFLYTPHRRYQELYDALMPGVEEAPLFFAHYVSWSKLQGGRVRDQEIVHTAVCLTTDDKLRSTFRPVALSILGSMPIRQLARTVRFVKGGAYQHFFGKPINSYWQTPDSIMFKNTQREIDAHWDSHKDTRYGLFNSFPKAAKTLVVKILRGLEANRSRWDRVTMTNRASMSYLYSTLHVRPGNDYYDYVLFPGSGKKRQLKHKAAAEDYEMSPFAAIATIGRGEVDAEQAALMIVEHNIPWQVATSLMGKSPVMMVALVHQMTPQQTIINLSKIEESGLLDNPDTRAIVEAKITQAKKDKRVGQSFQRTKGAEAQVQDAAIREQLGEVREKQTQAVSEINRATLLAFDMSGSLTEGIEISRELAPAVAAITNAPFWALAFNTGVIEIPVGNLQEMEERFSLIRAHGGTSIGAPLRVANRNEWPVEQIIVITDEEENTSPRFVSEYPLMADRLGFKPNVIVVKVGRYNGNHVVRACEELDIEFQVLDARRMDQYSLPQVLTMLARPGIFDLVQEILDTPLLKQR